jgi:hypothetical protein
VQRAAGQANALTTRELGTNGIPLFSTGLDSIPLPSYCKSYDSNIHLVPVRTPSIRRTVYLQEANWQDAEAETET